MVRREDPDAGRKFFQPAKGAKEAEPSDADKREAAGLPREKVEADDVAEHGEDNT